MSGTDLIRRSEAIEILENTDWYHQNRNKDMVSGANPSEHQAWYKADDVYKALESVPSAQPEQNDEWTNFLEKVIGTERLNVYRKLYREYQTDKGKPYEYEAGER